MKGATNRRVTLDDVARKAGLGRGTVSRVLRGEGHVSPKARAKVEAAVRALGYQANAAARALAGQRRGGKGKGQIEVVFLRHHYWWEDYFEAACKQAGIVGRCHFFGDFQGAEAAGRQLFARGVDGILLNPRGILWSDSELVKFGWERFPVVVLGRKSGMEGYDLVRHSAYDYMRAALNGLAKEGFRRIQVILHTSMSPADDEARIGAVLAFREIGPSADVEVRWQRSMHLLLGDGRLERLLSDEWHDVILFDHVFFPRMLKETGAEALLHGRAYAAAMTADAHDKEFCHVSGCQEDDAQVLSRAVNLLFDKIRLGAKGPARHPTEHVVEPVWTSRESTRIGRASG